MKRPLSFFFALAAALTVFAQPAPRPRPAEWAAPMINLSLENCYRVSDELYRCEQPKKDDIADLKALGIRSILNLRRWNSDPKALEQAGFKLIVERMEADDLTVDDLVAALRQIKAAPKPVLLHCWHGDDRAGAVDELRYGGFGYHEKWFPNIITLFETLDAATTATVLSPQISCPSSGGFGCGMALDAAESAGGGNQTGVIVLHEGTVGPYDTVTLKATQPGALNNWLTQNGYKIDPATQPIVDAYVSEGFDFIALRLQPSAGVRQMKPVRVLSQGADPSLPLRMVAAGTGAQVAFTLFTISEARYETKNFENAITPRELLLWNFETNKSNYADLRLGPMAQNQGETWTSFRPVPGWR